MYRLPTRFQFAVEKYSCSGKVFLSNRCCLCLESCQSTTAKLACGCKIQQLWAPSTLLMPVLGVHEQFLNVAKAMLQSCPQCSNHLEKQFLNSPRAVRGGRDFPSIFNMLLRPALTAPWMPKSTRKGFQLLINALRKQRMWVLNRGPCPGWGRALESRGCISLCPFHPTTEAMPCQARGPSSQGPSRPGDLPP